MNFKIRAFAVLGSILLLMAGIPATRAQSVSAAIQGTVADTSGAMMPDANVELTNDGTGVVLKARTDASGNYSFPSVELGVYSLEVSKQGFTTYSISHFGVLVGQHVTENATLRIAATAQSVTVEAHGLANLLETESNDLGDVIGPQSVAQLPLNGRNFLQLGLLSGASQSTAGLSSDTVTQTGHPGMSINIAGEEPDYSMYLVNGIETIGTRAGNSSLNLSMGAIDQFEVHYGFFMPDMGTNAGVVDVITKAGTNKFHGDAFEYVRNNQMEARNYFSSTPPGPYHQNQFGADVGGPILRSKLFFFGNYEGYRQDQSSFVGAYTPTQAMFGGDFSAVSNPIYDPTTYNPTTGQRTQFPNNIIPSGRINSVAKQLLAFYLPGSSLTATPNNVGGTPAQVLNSDQATGRLDASLNSKNQIFAQGTWLNSPAIQPSLFPSTSVTYPLDTELVALGWTSTLSPAKVNELRLGVVRDSVYEEGSSVNGLENKLGITGTADPNGVPGISITGYTPFGNSTGLIGDIDNSYQISDGFNWLHGNHQVKFGAALNYSRSVQSSANGNARGKFAFNDIFSAQTAPASGGTVNLVAGTGNAFADFLLGDPVTGASVGMPRTHYRWTTFQPYIQDTWKLRKNLTANLALGWYASTPPNPPDQTNKDLIHGFNFTTGLETFAALGTANPEVYSMTMDDFAPRIGFTWQPDFAKNTVVRAGWGMYYTTQMDVNAQYSVVSQYITINNSVSNSSSQPIPTWVMGVNMLPTVTVGQITTTQIPTISGDVFYLSANQHSPTISQWNLDLEHTFGTAYMLDVAYVGNEGHHLLKAWNPWDCSSPGSQVCNPAANNPYYGKYTGMQEIDSIGNGSYNAMIVKLQRQFADGLGILANYSWAKSLTDSQEGFPGAALNQNKSCFRCDWGMSASNVPQSLVVSAEWDLPVGRGKKFGTAMNPVLDTVIGGWNVDAIVTMQKGSPFTVTAPNNTPIGSAQTRADWLCDGRARLSNKNLRTNGLLWIDKACFVNPATDPANTSGTPWAYGTVHYDGITGPGINNWDIGTHKGFVIHDSIQFVVRGEFFNAWNHTQFNNFTDSNGTLVTSPVFGQVSSAGAAREIQIGGTLSF